MSWASTRGLHRCEALCSAGAVHVPAVAVCSIPGPRELRVGSCRPVPPPPDFSGPMAARDVTH